MSLGKSLRSLLDTRTLVKDVARAGNLRVIAALVGPALRGLRLRAGERPEASEIQLQHRVHFDWTYDRDLAEMARLFEAAKVSQWNATTALDWSQSVDPLDPQRPLLPDEFMPVATLPSWRRLTDSEKAAQRHGLLSWILSQFLHGEQGALFAAAQVTEAVPWLDAKLYGSTQVADEGRHVQVLQQYLSAKLEKTYRIDENLYVIIDALMTDRRWDLKFLGMQIMIEGLALGAFGTMRKVTPEPLLRKIFEYLITDEARHVHYGVLALRKFYEEELSPREKEERAAWAFEISVLLRNRFLAHEFYDEYYGHQMSRAQWDRLVSGSHLVGVFRETMFRRIIPNLREIGLITARTRPLYRELGLLEFEGGKPAPQLTAAQMLEDA